MNDRPNESAGVRDAKLLAWVGNIIREAQEAKKFVQITIHVNDGVILRVENKQSFVPKLSSLKD